MKNHLEILGYLPIEIRIPPKYEKYLKFLKKLPIQRIQNCAIFTANALYNFQPIAFYFLESADPIDYQELFFFGSHAISCIATYTLFVLQKPTIIRLFGDFEALVERSKHPRIQ